MNKRACIVPGLSLCILAVALLYAGDGLNGIVSAASSAANLPGVRTLGSLSDKYRPVTFDHPKHVAIADNCATCHHQHEDSKKLPCKDCHAINPSVFKNSVTSSFLPCSSCHSAFDPNNPSVPGLKTAYHKQCFQCHRGMGNIGLDPKGCAEICHAKKPERIGMKTRR